MPNTSFSQIQREWFAARASLVSSSIHLVDLQKAYWSRGSLSSVGLKPLSQVEDEWWGLITAGASLPATRRASDLVAAAVGLYSSAAVSKIANENEYLFYSTVTISSLA